MERKPPVAVPLSSLHEAKVYVHGVTPSRISLYVKDAASPDGVKVVAVKHGSVKGYAGKLVDPPVGGTYKPMGMIDTDTYTGPSDVQPIMSGAAPEKAPMPPTGAPDPDKFVPIYDWDEKHVWVFVKTPKGVEGPAKIPHKKVQTYADKLGWLPQKMLLVGKIDPNVYSGPSDIYPLDWDPEDGAPESIPTSAQAVAVMFQPGAAKAAVAPVQTLKPKAKAAPPATTPGQIWITTGEFELQGKKDPNGYPWLKYKGTGENYSLLPGGKLAQWQPSTKEYLLVTKDESGWNVDHDIPAVSLYDLQPKPPSIPLPAGFELPEGFKVTSASPKAVFATAPDGSKLKWVAKTHAWVYADKPWQEYRVGLTAVPPPPEPAEEPKKKPVPKKTFPGAPVAPLGFEINGDVNNHGTWPLSTAEYTDDGNWFVSPKGKLLQYNSFTGMYEEWIWSYGTWTKSKASGIPPYAIATEKYYPLGGPAIPIGYEFKGYDVNGFPAIWKGHGTPVATLLPNGVLATWSVSKHQYKTQYGVVLTLDQIMAGDFGPAPSEVKQTVADVPEPEPKGVQYTGSVDSNGFPLVDEISDDEDDETLSKGLTLLPDDRVAIWKAVQGYYLVLSYDTSDGYVHSTKGEQVTVEVAQRLLASLGLIVKGGKYHKVTAGQKTIHAGVPEGFDPLTPTDGEEGLIPIKHLASWKPYYLLAGNLVAGAQGEGPLYDVFALTTDGFEKTQYKDLTLAQVGLMTKGLDPSPAEKTQFTGKVDLNGYPLVKTQPEDPDATGDILTLLPNGEVAQWKKDLKSYLVWNWDKWDKDFMPSHPTKYYALKQVLKLKAKKLPGGPAPAGSVSAPEPFVAPPKIEKDPYEWTPTGEKDALDYPLYSHSSTALELSKLPTDPPWGRWDGKAGAYRLWHWNDTLKKPELHWSGQDPVWWAPGWGTEPYAGKVEGGMKIPSAKVPPSAALKMAGTDINGYPEGVHKKPGGAMDGPFSQLPTGKIGQWSSEAGAYILVSFDPDSGSYYKSGGTWTPPGKHSSQANYYHTLPSGVDVMMPQLRDSKDTTVVVLPDGRYITPLLPHKVCKLGPDKIFSVTSEQMSDDDIEALLKANYQEVLSLKPLGIVDLNGLPVYEVADEPGKKLTKLPNGDMAKWSPIQHVYRKYEYDPDGFWTTSDPPESFDLDDVKAMYAKQGTPKVAAGKVPVEPEKPVGPTPQEVAKAAKAAAKPTSAETATSKAIKDLAGKLPDPSTLKLVGDGKKLGMAGAGEKSVYQDPASGLKFIFKPAYPKSGHKIEAFRAHAQEAAAALALKVRPDHIPVKTVEVNGVLGTLQPMVDLDPKGTVREAHLSPSQLTDQQKLDVATDHLMDWMQSQFDSHSGNMLITASGRIVSVDKEQGFRYFANDKLDVDFHPNAQYGEGEPYYNTFWRDFRDGKVDFDPLSLVGALDKIEGIDSKEYVESLRPYAQSAFPGDEMKQEKFLRKVLLRKLQLRKDFERFIADLYQKRTKEKGTFTFSEGWISEKESGTKKFMKVKQTAEEVAISAYQIKLKDYLDPATNEPRPELGRLTLKVSKETSPTKLFEFLEEMGLKAIPAFTGEEDPRVMTGQTYHMVVVDKAEFYAAHVTKEVPIESHQSTSSQPKYWPDASDYAPKTPNVEDLAKIDSLKPGREGHGIMTDGLVVEGQTAKVKKWKDSKGEYYFVKFKLRPELWKKIESSAGVKDGATFTFRVANYDRPSGLFIETSTKVDMASGVSWTHGDTECFLATDSHRYAYMGSVYLKVRGVKESAVLATVKAALNAVKAGSGDEVFKNPTKEEREVAKLMRILWSKRPQKADELSKMGKVSLDDAKAALKAAKVSKEEIDSVTEEEVMKGYHAHVLPGRWKQMKGAPKFVFNGISGLEAALSILQSGLMSIQERNLTGIPQFGGSYPQDVTSGSGDGILCRVVCEPGFGYAFQSHSFCGEYQAVLHPDVLDRLDTYMYDHDEYGRCREDSHNWQTRKPVEKIVEGLGSSHSTGNEISFRIGVHKAKIIRVATASETSRKSLIIAARDKGLAEVNGVPIEDFVVVVTKLGDAYNKYVKPLVGG